MNTFLWLLLKIDQKCIPLNDNIVWYKSYRVIKDLPSSDRFFLFNVPKYLSTKLLYFLYPQIFCVFEIYHEKNPWNLKSFFVKISPLRIFSSYCFKFFQVITSVFYLTKFQSYSMTSFHKKRVNWGYGALRLQTCFIVGENMRKQVPSKN